MHNRMGVPLLFLSRQIQIQQDGYSCRLRMSTATSNWAARKARVPQHSVSAQAVKCPLIDQGKSEARKGRLRMAVRQQRTFVLTNRNLLFTLRSTFRPREFRHAIFWGQLPPRGSLLRRALPHLGPQRGCRHAASTEPVSEVEPLRWRAAKRQS